MSDTAPTEIFPLVARTAVIITPKAPYLDWAKKIVAPDGRATDGGLIDSPTRGLVFLIHPEIQDEHSARNWVRDNCERIFAQMLTDWHHDLTTWPRSLDKWSVFIEWFDIRFVAGVHDMDEERPWLERNDDDL